MELVAASHFKDFNSLLEVLREKALSQYQPMEEDTALKALEAMQVQEEAYFCQVTYQTWEAILHDIREAHKDNTDSAPDGSNALKLIKDAKKALAVPGLSGCIHRPDVYISFLQSGSFSYLLYIAVH